jgi:2-polyprenyl-6-methoxyphenol hydroxylase-like FAD-dependent oxidoreductase
VEAAAPAPLPPLAPAAPAGGTEGWDLRVFAVTPSSQRVLDAAGAWRHIAATGRECPYTTMQVTAGTDGAGRAGGGGEAWSL